MGRAATHRAGYLVLESEPLVQTLEDQQMTRANGEGRDVASDPTPKESTDALYFRADPTACTEKSFTNLRASFALAGHALHRSDPADGTVSFYAERWGLVRFLPTLDDAREFLKRIGGAP